MCIYDVLTLSDDTLRSEATTLAALYNVDPDDLICELLAFRSQYGNKAFQNFADFAKFVLLKLSTDSYGLLQFFTQIILILPFATADCERSFSAMNRIKSGERSSLKEILNSLMLLYDITPAEKASLDLNKLARELRSNVWKYKKKKIWPHC